MTMTIMTIELLYSAAQRPALSCLPIVKALSRRGVAVSEQLIRVDRPKRRAASERGGAAHCDPTNVGAVCIDLCGLQQGTEAVALGDRIVIGEKVWLGTDFRVLSVCLVSVCLLERIREHAHVCSDAAAPSSWRTLPRCSSTAPQYPHCASRPMGCGLRVSPSTTAAAKKNLLYARRPLPIASQSQTRLD